MDNIIIEPSKVFDSPYYSMNKRLLSIIGLWPDLGGARKKASLAVYTLVIFSSIIPLISGFKDIWGVDLSAVIENCIVLLYVTTSYIKYISAYFFMERIELVYKQTVLDWESLSDDAELKILHRYSRLGRLLTFVFVVYSAFAVCVFNSFPYIPLLLDKFLPMENQTRQRIYPYHPEYFVIDGEKYYMELFTSHGILVVLCSTLVAVAIDTTMVANIIHACGLFRVVCYRLENIGYSSESEENAGTLVFADEREVNRRCKKVCELHLSSVRSIDKIQNSFSISFLVVIVAGVLAVAMLMFDLIYCFQESNFLLMPMLIVMLIGINICIFYLNWVAQQVINSSEEVFQSAYHSGWYNLSPKSRKLVCIIMQNSIEPISLTAASICDLNLEMFAAVIKSAMSYATIILSLQKT